MGRRIIYLISVLGCAAFYVIYQEWFSWLLLLTVVGLPWFSLLLSLPGFLTFRVQVNAPYILQLGDKSDTWISGASPFPVPPYQGSLRLTHQITGEQQQEKMGCRTPTDHCGGIGIASVKVRVSDYLALFRFRIRKSQEAMVIVRPVPVKMEVPPDLERYLTLVWKPKPGGGFSENHELRLYRPGDGLNHVHWKLTAKTGKLIIREPMEPIRGRMLLTMDLTGSAPELDRKFGRLLWLGNYLLEQNATFDIRVRTGNGVISRYVSCEEALWSAVDHLLCCPAATGSDANDREYLASWQYHIGGSADEA